MQLDHTHLKVDQTLLHLPDAGYLLVSNVNIPEAEFVNLDAVLVRTQQFIDQDYLGLQNHIHYQVCATYELQNVNTGEIRHWSGSFNPRGNRFNVLSQFQPYQANTFRGIVAHACSPNNVYNRLRFFHVSTAWVFRRISSAIITLQARIRPDHDTVNRRGLLQIRNGRRSRVHVTFYLE